MDHPDNIPLTLSDLYNRLLAHFGHQGWWPGDSPFEVIIGAVLTQNTSWINVGRAISNLKRESVLDPDSLLSLPLDRLRELIKPSGFYNQKADRLRKITHWWQELWYQNNGDISHIATKELRQRLLAINGIGPETADSILLYALDRSVFVIDAYTRRILNRLGLATGNESYDQLQTLFEHDLPCDTELYSDFHAQFVMLGKNYCRPQPHCSRCPVGNVCVYFDEHKAD